MRALIESTLRKNRVSPEYAIIPYFAQNPNRNRHYCHVLWVFCSGPFPPLTGKDCPNPMPTGVTYKGCYNGQSGWTTDGFTPKGA